jgi:hypothetical protein
LRITYTALAPNRSKILARLSVERTLFKMASAYEAATITHEFGPVEVKKN